MKPSKYARVKARQRVKRDGEPYNLALKRARRNIEWRHRRLAAILLGAQSALLVALACIVAYSATGGL